MGIVRTYDNRIEFYDSEDGDTLLTAYDNGDIEILDGNIELAASGGATIKDTSHSDAEIDFADGTVEVRALTSGSTIVLRDSHNTQDILSAAVGGNVTIPSGDIIDGASNTVYDQSNNYVPQARVEQGSGSGLNADTVDGQDHADLQSEFVDASGDQISGPLKDGSGNNMLKSVAATGSVTLSSGEAVVNTGISATDATFQLALGIDDPNADAKVAGKLFWDDSAGVYKMEFEEKDTAVGNPTVNYDVIRVR